MSCEKCKSLKHELHGEKVLRAKIRDTNSFLSNEKCKLEEQVSVLNKALEEESKVLDALKEELSKSIKTRAAMIDEISDLQGAVETSENFKRVNIELQKDLHNEKTLRADSVANNNRLHNEIDALDDMNNKLLESMAILKKCLKEVL